MAAVHAVLEDMWFRLEQNSQFKGLFTFSSKGTLIGYLVLDHAGYHTQAA